MKALGIVLAIILAIVVIVVIITILRGGPSGESGGGEASLFKSEDGGETWKKFDKFNGGDINTFSILEDDASSFLIGTERRGLWKASKDGEIFEQYPVSLGEGSKIFDILEPASSKKFIALVFYTNRGRVIKSEKGERKELLFTPLEKFAFLKGFSSNMSNTIELAGSDGGIYKSFDAGGTWSVISRFREGITIFEVNPENNFEIWAANPRGQLFRSSSGGLNWKELTKNLNSFPKARNIKIIHYDPRNNILYHGSQFGLLASRDKGESWTALPLLLPPEALSVEAISPAPNSSSKLYVGAGNQLYISEDAGASWKVKTLSGRGVISEILIERTNPNTIFVGFRARRRF